MSIQTTTVTGTVYGPGGEPIANASITAKLSKSDTFNGVIVPVVEVATSAQDGTFSIKLWPNALGDAGDSSYQIKITHPQIATQYFTDLIVPSTSPVTLGQLILDSQVTSPSPGALTLSSGMLILSV